MQLHPHLTEEVGINCLLTMLELLPEFLHKSTSVETVNAFFRTLSKYQDFGKIEVIQKVMEALEDTAYHSSRLSTSNLQFLSTYVGVDGFALDQQVFSEASLVGAEGTSRGNAGTVNDLYSFDAVPDYTKEPPKPKVDLEGLYPLLDRYSVSSSTPLSSSNIADGCLVAISKLVKGSGLYLFFFLLYFLSNFGSNRSYY